MNQTTLLGILTLSLSLLNSHSWSNPPINKVLHPEFPNVELTDKTLADGSGSFIIGYPEKQPILILYTQLTPTKLSEIFGDTYQQAAGDYLITGFELSNTNHHIGIAQTSREYITTLYSTYNGSLLNADAEEIFMKHKMLTPSDLRKFKDFAYEQFSKTDLELVGETHQPVTNQAVNFFHFIAQGIKGALVGDSAQQW